MSGAGVQARAIVRAASGLDVSVPQAERAVRARLAQLGRAPADPDSYLASLDAHEVQQLLELVVVPESWLFRDRPAFDAAVAAVAARRAGGQQQVRALCVPCAAGEEAYSLAMALLDAGLDQGCRIDAVDLSAAAIARARAGRYGANAFRGPDQAFRARHFTREDGLDTIGPAPRALVRFEQGNLLTLQAPAPYELIFCRNLLIYFDAAATERACARLRALLAPGGILFAGYAEVPTFCQHGFAVQPLPGAFALKVAPPPAPAAGAAHGRPRPGARAEARGARTAGDAAPAPRGTPRTAPAQAARAAPVAHVARETPPAAGGTATATAPGAAPVAPLAHQLAQARALADRGELAQAAARCATLVERDPACADAWYLLGLAAAAAGEHAAASAHLRRCIYLAPQHYEALCQLAALAECTGEHAAAARLRARAARVYARREERP